MSSGTPAMVEAALAGLSAVLAILFSASLCLTFQAVAPTASGPVYVLFPYRGELVAIGLSGGVLPLLFSAMMVTVLSTPGRRITGPLPFRSLAYWLALLAVAVLLTLIFTASHELYGGLGLPRTWAFSLVLLGCLGGAVYWARRGRMLRPSEGAAECYVMGTLAVFISDLVRTLSGQASAPGEAAVLGGGGLLDILFWFGLYVAASFLCMCAFQRLTSRAYKALERTASGAGGASSVTAANGGLPARSLEKAGLYLPRILKSLVPQDEHVPCTALRPFFMRISRGEEISLFAFSLTQNAWVMVW